MEPTSTAFLDNTREALQHEQQRQRRDMLGHYLPAVRDLAVDSFPDYERVRQHVRTVRDHTLDNLDHYLAEFEKQALNNGNQVHWARDAEELNDCVLEICQRHDVRKVAKGKSMVTEETDLRGVLEQAGMQVTETDLGEYIIQQAGEPPSHIVGPALHKSREEITELFLQQHDLGTRQLDDPAALVKEARSILRERFLQADIGVIGANALIAENGYSMLVTNEGNGDLTASLPRVLVVCTTIDRVLPRARDATAMLRLLVRSATGQPITAYTSFYSGPRRPGDPDGPLETHFVLLDNRRSDLLASDYRDMLRCIRCGACLQHCPIYIGVGGHAYGSTYPGPMGSVLTPLLNGLEQSSALPEACTSCGRCAEVCPSAIPLPDLLRELRHEANEQKLTPRRWRLGMKLHAWIARQPRLYHLLSNLGVRVLHRLGARSGAFRSLPLAGAWTSERDFPTPQKQTFMAQYRKQRKQDDE